MEILPLIIQLVSGACGGTAAGKLFPKVDMGGLINVGIGLFGGVICSRLLGMVVGWFITVASSMDTSIIIVNILGGVVGGGALLIIIGSFGGGPIGQK